ncbi:tRNA (adenosine(37)-N6)-dimethylallyltransferase MiaA [Campylobacter corcagiensis]|uniref:tRNA dimethylallyltransferase n=1 Tax=Campylobacter corcagiensis TaxID=1448857 RepID=A0A7M1LGU9_9BACT|nr:tRNA (adenosine(37)-N6)-dimethylallyltransferase MiaA [Campylobacter corcagiensis]QKF64010.1 tRNA(i6A37) synthase [Campylobacter corcagiensis]QOQ87788.1 tRNA (adenosine(37)-N6)-dimethylallyltransferase MiaA [Campylobacter corcagiensis]
MFKEFGILGPTASGKSDLALNLALGFNGVILSLDALSVYKEIDIASAKPSKNDLKSVKHFGVNLVCPNEHFSVGDFINEYKKAKEFAFTNDKILIITGGTGFYLKAMMSGLSPKIEDVKTNLSNFEIYELSLKVDPEFAAKFSKNDSYRLLKWYSIYKITGEIPTIFLRENRSEPIIKNLKIFEILSPPEVLNPRIITRTKNMIKSGLMNEAKYLFNKYGYECKALNSVGLKECGEVLSGKISKDNLENLIQTHTIQLAKRQRTFFRSQFKDKISAPIKDLKGEISKFISGF